MMGTESYLQNLLVSHPLRAATLRSAIQALELPPGSRGLDVGCGIGRPALLLAEAVGSQGHVAGLDVTPEFLAFGRESVKESFHTFFTCSMFWGKVPEAT